MADTEALPLLCGDGQFGLGSLTPDRPGTSELHQHRAAFAGARSQAAASADIVELTGIDHHKVEGADACPQHGRQDRARRLFDQHEAFESNAEIRRGAQPDIAVADHHCPLSLPGRRSQQRKHQGTGPRTVKMQCCTTLETTARQQRFEWRAYLDDRFLGTHRRLLGNQPQRFFGYRVTDTPHFSSIEHLFDTGKAGSAQGLRPVNAMNCA